MATDEALLDRLRRGDIDAFDVLYARYELRLFAYLRALLRDRHDAEEIFHDAFLAAVTRAPPDLDEGAFRPFLYRVARNAALNRLRGAARRQAAHDALATDDARAPAADETLATAELQGALDRAVARLPTALGELYHLRSTGLSYEQIAGVVEAPVGTIKSRMHQLVHALREELKPWIAPE